MSCTIEITRAGPMVSIQDMGRPGMLGHGVSASGPMDRDGFVLAQRLSGGLGHAGLECGALGVDFLYRGSRCMAGFAGGQFRLAINGADAAWPGALVLEDGDSVSICTGPAGNYGYLVLGANIDVPPVMGSRATNITMGLGGFEGRALKKGDVLKLSAPNNPAAAPTPLADRNARENPDAIRVILGVHAELFDTEVLGRFLATEFRISAQIDRMGVRLADPGRVFAGQVILSLVSDAVVAGDIQILGDGMPVVLMRDHQPTGGYPRIATVISSDLDRLAQMRPGSGVRFRSLQVREAQAILRQGGRP